MMDHTIKTKYRIDWTKVISSLKKVANYTLLLVALFAGFFIGRISYKVLPDIIPVSRRVEIKKLNEISIAINESDQMLIINKKNGQYEMFADSVGLTIFKMYANRIYQTKP